MQVRGQVRGPAHLQPLVSSAMLVHGRVLLVLLRCQIRSVSIATSERGQLLGQGYAINVTLEHGRLRWLLHHRRDAIRAMRDYGHQRRLHLAQTVMLAHIHPFLVLGRVPLASLVIQVCIPRFLAQHHQLNA